MAAWFGKQNPKLISRLESEQYPYAIKDAIRFSRDTQLVIVGPFDSSSDARLALGDLKKISRDAFITKIK